jgi:hypothetical protein
MSKYLNNFYIFKIIIRKFGAKDLMSLYLSCQAGKTASSFKTITLWGDEIAKAWQTCPLVSRVRITG